MLFTLRNLRTGRILPYRTGRLTDAVRMAMYLRTDMGLELEPVCWQMPPAVKWRKVEREAIERAETKVSRRKGDRRCSPVTN